MNDQQLFDQIVSVLQTKYPGSHWNLRGSAYTDFEWLDDSSTKPTASDLGL